MFSIEDAVSYSKSVGIRFVIRNENGCIFGVAKTKPQAFKRIDTLSAQRPTMRFHVEEIDKLKAI